MNSDLKKTPSNGTEKPVPAEEQQAKINEVRKLIGPLPEKLSIYCSDAQLARYLHARNWHVKKATKMLKGTIKWRANYKPEEIRWEEVAPEAETGKIYRTDFVDKQGRTVLVIRPSRQNSKSLKEQLRYVVYCMENAVMNLPPEQEQMAWLIDFDGFNLSNISVKVTQETINILQDHYPERLGLAVLYNPPKFFEPFWKMVKPFLEPKTRKKVRFVYDDDLSTKKIMEEVFNMDEMESAFGGNDSSSFDINRYAERMREDDKRTPSLWKIENAPPNALQAAELPLPSTLESTNLDFDSDATENEKTDDIPSDGTDDEKIDVPPSHGTDSEEAPVIDVKILPENTKIVAAEAKKIDSEEAPIIDAKILPENAKIVAAEAH